MCRAVTCKTCGKTTWAGCGQHVDSVMKNVAQADRCPGHAKEQGAGSGESGGGFLSKLFNR